MQKVRESLERLGLEPQESEGTLDFGQGVILVATDKGYKLSSPLTGTDKTLEKEFLPSVNPKKVARSIRSFMKTAAMAEYVSLHPIPDICAAIHKEATRHGDLMRVEILEENGKRVIGEYEVPQSSWEEAASILQTVKQGHA